MASSDPAKVEAAYKLLDLDADASLADLGKQWRKISKIAHPDRHPPENKGIAERLYKNLTDAHDTVEQFLTEKARIAEKAAKLASKRQARAPGAAGADARWPTSALYDRAASSATNNAADPAVPPPSPPPPTTPPSQRPPAIAADTWADRLVVGWYPIAVVLLALVSPFVFYDVYRAADEAWFGLVFHLTSSGTGIVGVLFGLCLAIVDFVVFIPAPIAAVVGMFEMRWLGIPAAFLTAMVYGVLLVHAITGQALPTLH
jgi:hypothetical protein